MVECLMTENILDKQDVNNLAQNTNVENKTIVAQKLGNFYSTKDLSPSLVKLAEDIFRIMVRDTEILVREALADSLKNCNGLPKDVVEAIINDKDSVAVPFLQYYSALTKEELIKILEMPGVAKHKAVAKRVNLPDEMSKYIAERCSDEVVGELVSNEKAIISEKTFDVILAKYSENEDIKKRLVYRSELPPSIVEKIVDKLSYKLKTYLMLHHNLTKDMASNLVEEVKERITISISEEYSSDNQIYITGFRGLGICTQNRHRNH